MILLGIRNFLIRAPVLIIFSILTTSFLVFLAYQKAWHDHLHVDFGFYYRVAHAFFQNLSFGITPQNSYFPGSLFFFLIPAISFLFSNYSWDAFVASFIATNVLLIFIHLVIYYKKSSASAYIFLGILIFAGPLLLFRHELFPSLILIFSILLLKQRHSNLAFLTLGLATSTKIYPAFVLPYYLILTFKNGHKNKLVSGLAFFLLGILLTFGAYLWLGSPFSELTKSLSFNADKPVHIESLWASLLTLKGKLIDGAWILGKPDQNGIYGLDPRFVQIPLYFFNYAWTFPLLLFYLYIFKKTKKGGDVQTEVVFLIILLFILFSKVVTPQYLFWFLPLFPLFDLSRNRILLAASFLVIILVVSTTQYIYPLHYSELLWKFYMEGVEEKYFYVLLARNILLIILFFLCFKLSFSKELNP